MYEDFFDAEHCKKTVPRIERLISKSYHSIVLPEESKKKIIDLGTSSILYACLHRSHFDYIAICLKIFLEGLPYPRTIAGSNLLIGIIGRLIKHLTGIDMMKSGAILMERTSSISRDLFDICTRIEMLLRSDKPILVFPEMEIINNGEIKSIKTGRAYSGKIRKFASSLFSPAINVSKEGKKVFIVPIAVSYDFIAEDSCFGKLAKADKMRKSGNVLTSFAGKLYYVFLELHFFHKMYWLGKGNIYIDTGQPIPVEPDATRKELAQRAQEEVAKCYRITMPALVSYAIRKGANSKDELQKSVERYAAILNEANTNFEHSANLKESIESALHGLEQRKIISNLKEIYVRRPEIISYYANTIAHHFGDK